MTKSWKSILWLGIVGIALLVVLAVWFVALPAFGCVIYPGSDCSGEVVAERGWLVFLLQVVVLWVPPWLFVPSLILTAITGLRLVRYEKQRRTRRLKIVFVVSAVLLVLSTAIPLLLL